MSPIISQLSSPHLLATYQQYGLRYVGLFGSQSRGDQKIDSDVDILIEYGKPKTFFELAQLKRELESVLTAKVDLVRKKNIKISLKPFIEQDLVTIYDEN